MAIQFIDLKKQYNLYKEEIDSRLQSVLDQGNYIMGPEVTELELLLAEYTGVSHCISVSSGTHSIEIAFRALGIGPGDEVITVPFTWISSAETIGLVGARPVFVDIDPVTFNMDITKIEQAITSKTKAILPVSLFGQMPDFEALNTIADRHGIIVIEDAAQSFGATQGGRKSCGVTPIASTSFFPAKPFGCYGDGGALFCSDNKLADKMRAIRSHGGIIRHHHEYLGTNGRFDTLQAAVLLAKFPHFNDEIDLRWEIGNRYNRLLNGYCTIPEVRQGNTHVFAQYTIRLPERDRVKNQLEKKGVPTGIYYPKCLHEQPVFKELGYERGDFPESEKASEEVLSLPMHPFLTNVEQDTIVEKLKRCIN